MNGYLMDKYQILSSKYNWYCKNWRKDSIACYE